MKQDLAHRIYSIFGRAFRVPVEKLSNETRRGHLEAWDSLSHIVLVETLSKELGVNISPERALEMHTLGDIVKIISTLVQDHEV